MKRYTFVLASFIFFASIAGIAYADHSWGGYHWGRTANPLVLKLGDAVGAAWDSTLQTASADWSLSTVLDTNVVTSTVNPKVCKATSGRVEVCNSKYGNNGWLGIAQVWVTGGEHITQGVVKLNDTYFSTKKYNTPEWRNLVTCQEIGHTFGLDHQDEDFANANLGTCMDYTNLPADNQHPNLHDYEMLESIYAHLDTINTSSVTTAPANPSDIDVSERKDWGKSIRKDSKGNSSVYRRDLGDGQEVFTFVVWAN